MMPQPQQQQVQAQVQVQTIQQQPIPQQGHDPSAGSPIPQLYDLFLDLPHPCASSSCPGPFLIDAPQLNPTSGSTSSNNNNNNNNMIAAELHKNLLQIVRFAFPEYDEAVEQQQQNQGGSDPRKLMINRYDVYAVAPQSQQQIQQQSQQQQQLNQQQQQQQQASQRTSFQSFTFSLQLSNGIRVHGHVRRYLPPHLVARTRYDVGRRGERALCILTRSTGADLLYSSILKTVEAISSQQAAMSFGTKMPHRGEPQKWFLHQLSRYQQHLCGLYGTKPGMERGKPLIAAIPCMEIGEDYHTLYKDVELSRFIIPIILLQRQVTLPQVPTPITPASSNVSKQIPLSNPPSGGSIVPLLRCVGVIHALRIMSALLSERRIVLVSASPTRLATCSNAAISMLSCGLLHWQHLYIPVLPPHLWPYLAAPYPYLIGILSSAAYKLDRTDGLGEVLIIHLDTNQLETRGIDSELIPQRIPDLFFRAGSSFVASVTSSVGVGGGGGGTEANFLGGGGNNSPSASASEQLAQDLFETLKLDRKILYGVSPANAVNAFVGETATKATQAVKNTFCKLRDKGRQYLSQRSNVSASATNTSDSNAETGGGMDEQNQDVGDNDDFGTLTTSSSWDGQPGGTTTSSAAAAAENSLASDYIYTEGCHNETSEYEARISFTSFFLCLIGDVRWYLSTPPGGQPNQSTLQLDRAKFLQQKRAMGEGEGTAMFPLLTSFCQTQMLEEFAKARIEEIRIQHHGIAQDSPLFLQCCNYHRQHRIDFGILNVKRIVREIAENDPKLTGMLQTNVRRTAMTLTSNKGYEGDSAKVIAQLVDQCRESTSVLFDVMSVIWMRLRDCKGMQWKHALHSLQILRNLLYHGPLAALTETIDGLDKIRALKYYENMRPVSVTQVRAEATIVYNLLVDRAKLFQIRRTCIERRRQIQFPDSTMKREHDRNARIGVPFRAIHAAMNPASACGTVVPLPPMAPVQQTMVRETPQQTALQAVQAPQPVPTSTSSSRPPAQTQQEVDFFAMTTPQQQASNAQMQPSANNDLLNLFDTMAVSTNVGQPPAAAVGAVTASSSNPFDAFAAPTRAPVGTGVPSPLMVQVPPAGNIGVSGTSPQFAQTSPPPQNPPLPQQVLQTAPVPQQPNLPVNHPYAQQQHLTPTFAVVPQSQRALTPPMHHQQQPIAPMTHSPTPPQQHQQPWPHQQPPFPIGQQQPHQFPQQAQQQQQYQHQHQHQQQPNPVGRPHQPQFPSPSQQNQVQYPGGYAMQQQPQPPHVGGYPTSTPQQQANPTTVNRTGIQFDPFAKK